MFTTRESSPGRMPRLVLTLVAGALSTCCVLSACSPEPSTSATDAITVKNCGTTVTIQETPNKVALMKSASVATLARLGVLDKVVARAGAYPKEYFSKEINAQLAKIPSITDKLDPSGHLQISREQVMAVGPDLVIGETDTVNHQTMASSNIPLVEEPAFCEGGLGHAASFADVWQEVQLYGTIFNRSEEAEAYIAELKKELAEIKPVSGNPRVAVLYPTIGGGVTYAYGAGSMANPVVEAAGGVNVFADQADRVFEVTAEEIISRNPDYIIALYTAGNAKEIADAVRALKGFSTTTAGKNDAILPMLLNFAEPPTPLAVQGVQMVRDFLAGK